ncbi:MAG: Nif3-like dinuclear metal center hexameric protein [Bacilli bacterium]|nr:Nif3-like dinuclear metal center hexameric protein [Bacilli bacterium]
MNTVKLLRNLAKRFPKSIRTPGDYVGLMTGKLPEEVHTILLCLDFDDIVYDEILKMKKKPDMILTHHPFIYGTRYRVLKHSEIKRDLVERIDKMGIPVYSMHTNFDTGKGGMNDALAEALGLENIRPLETISMARGGELPKAMEIHEFAKYATQRLNLDYSHLVHGGKDKVKSVAIIGGGGSYKYVNAMLEGYDIYISGDAPHHIRRDVIAAKYNFLDVSHEVEKIFMPQMAKLLKEIDPSLETIIIDHEKLPELITK